MKVRLLRGLVPALLLVAGFAFSSAGAAGASTRTAVHPYGGCIGPFCGRVYNQDNSGQVYIVDNWCGSGPCGNFAVLNPGGASTSYFNDTDGFAPGPNTCNLYVEFFVPGGSWFDTVNSWVKIDDTTTAYVLDAWC